MNELSLVEQRHESLMMLGDIKEAYTKKMTTDRKYDVYMENQNEFNLTNMMSGLDAVPNLQAM